jgi:predicted dehydrogenase
MLSEVDCNVVGIGDYYGKRGSIAIRALQAGRHVVADKPLCTSLEELRRIEDLSASKRLKAGCMLDMRDSAVFRGVRQLIQQGTIGEVHAMAFSGQHPLLLGTRPSWYFEPGKHGGTINDIAIHALDFIPWATGLSFTAINAARCWNAFIPQYPHFKDGSQMMLTMDNGCGVLGDVSYFAPNSQGYNSPFYWRMTFWGRKGVLEASTNMNAIILAMDGEKEVRHAELAAPAPGGYLKAFLDDVAGHLQPDGLNTRSVLAASRLALAIQEAADEGLRELRLALP